MSANSNIILDSKIYSEIHNNLLTRDELQSWREALFPNEGTMTDDEIQEKLNSIISHTTIKRACCLASQDPNKPDYYKINVRIPMPEEVDPSKLSSDIYKEF